MYPYKSLVGVPPLAMVDDILCVSECSLNFISAKSTIKKTAKCHKIHVGKTTVVCPVLYIDQWDVEEVNEIESLRMKMS